MDNRRLILFVIFSFSIFMLWQAWEKQHLPGAAPSASVQQAPGVGVGNVPSAPVVSGTPATVPAANAAVDSAAQKVEIRTDMVAAELSVQGGDLVRLELLHHKADGDSGKNLLLFDSGEYHIYLGQSGLIGESQPNHKTVWKLVSGPTELKEGQDSLDVSFEATGPAGKVVKTYTFHRGSYLIDVAFAGATNANGAYFHVLRDGQAKSSGYMGANTFTGPAVYTEQEKFQKNTFENISKGKAKYVSKADDGWIAMIQHYFVSAWLPQSGVSREFYIDKLDGDLYRAGVKIPVVDGKAAVSLYAGPEEQDKLKTIAPGLNLVVDYGWLAMIAVPLFWVLETFHKLVGNWGWAIILLTLSVKAIFYPLSAASYKSMAKMKLVAPKLQKLKEMYGDDKARLNQEMMEMYKKEKINPLGGCLPMLVQIPVFISLYWTLLGAVEMRGAPWILWITDLSTKDPYYVLPLIMGATMLFQTRLNPAPPDPVQAKVMLMMPIVFTGMFLFFPSGLVLYWVVNNVLSIAQQWQITRMINGEKKAA